jgi:hypothetical protein
VPEDCQGHRGDAEYETSEHERLCAISLQLGPTQVLSLSWRFVVTKKKGDDTEYLAIQCQDPRRTSLFHRGLTVKLNQVTRNFVTTPDVTCTPHLMSLRLFYKREQVSRARYFLRARTPSCGLGLACVRVS